MKKFILKTQSIKIIRKALNKIVHSNKNKDLKKN